MAPGTLITLTFLDPMTGEPIKEFSRAFVPWGVLKMALPLFNMDQDNMTEDDVDAINALIVEFYDHEFTIEELKKHVDFLGVFPVFQEIGSRMNMGPNGNPTLPGAKSPAKRTSTKRKTKAPGS